MNAWDELQALGKNISERWARHARDERVFPELSLAALRETDLTALRFQDLIDIALFQPALPPQADMEASFGQPPCSLFRGEGFYIEALFWTDALLSIHRHRFSGAFAVLEGSSLHTRYGFHAQRRVCSALLLGQLELTHAELLQRGDARPIHAGSELIHATYHLEEPCVTLLVRTPNEWGMGPPYDYRYPTVAFDPAYEGRMVKKRLQVLAMLRRAEPEAYPRAALALLEREDLFGSYLVLEQLFESTLELPVRERGLSLLRERFGEIADSMAASYVAQDRLRQLMQLRQRTRDPELRFFLAVLANVPSRRRISELVEAFRPAHDPVALIMGWLQRMPAELLYDPLAGSSALAQVVRSLLSGEEIPVRAREILRSSAVLGPFAET